MRITNRDMVSTYVSNRLVPEAKKNPPGNGPQIRSVKLKIARSRVIVEPQNLRVNHGLICGFVRRMRASTINSGTILKA